MNKKDKLKTFEYDYTWKDGYNYITIIGIVVAADKTQAKMLVTDCYKMEDKFKDLENVELLLDELVIDTTKPSVIQLHTNAQ